MGIDLLEIKDKYVLVAIDYYTSRIWTTVLKTKRADDLDFSKRFKFALKKININADD